VRLAALVLGAVLAISFVGEAIAQVGNLDGTILPSAVRAP